MFDSETLMQAVIQGDAEKVAELVRAGLDQEVPPGEILKKGLIAAMDIVGERMENEDMFIPEVLMSAQAMGKGVEIIKPLLAEGESSVSGKVIIGTVKGDLHDIGKNLVSMMLESSGLEVYNIGVDIPPEKFVEEIREKNADMLCLSALLTTTMPMMKSTVDAVAESGLRDQVKIMIGGAPVTQAFADEIGADGFAPDAGSAVRLAKSLM